MRGMKKAIGTDSHLENKWGNEPSVKNAAMSAILGRKRLRTRNQIGNVIITLFSVYAPNIPQLVWIVKSQIGGR